MGEPKRSGASSEAFSIDVVRDRAGRIDVEASIASMRAKMKGTSLLYRLVPPVRESHLRTLRAGLEQMD